LFEEVVDDHRSSAALSPLSDQRRASVSKSAR
jgi:hypothetical protein